MNSYAKYGYRDFILALGYKSHIIKEYFLNYDVYSNDFKINTKNKSIKLFEDERGLGCITN